MTLEEKSYIGKNKHDVDTKMYFHQDVKEAVNEFMIFLNCEEEYSALRGQFLEIFGDFQKTKK